MNLADELRMAASRHALGLLSPEEMVRLADAALDDGHYSGPIDALAMHRSSPHPSAVELAPIFIEWLEETGVQLPSPDEAAWNLLRFAIRRIVRNEVPPLRGLGDVIQVGFGMQEPDRFDLRALYAAHRLKDELDDTRLGEEHPGRGGDGVPAELESYVRQLCDIWWRVHGPSPSLSPSSPEAARLRGPLPPSGAVFRPRSVPRWRSRIYVIGYAVWVALVVAAIVLLW
jgi:hypothetical protein